MTKILTAFIAIVSFASAALLASRAPAQAAEPLPVEVGRGLKTAVFAGGCFWCVESDFEKLDGVTGAISGYTGGLIDNPTYENHEGYLEAVEVIYDPKIVTYRQLVDYLLRHIDPLDAGGQFCDRGPSYTSAIFASDASEWADAQASIAEAETELGKKIVTPIRDRGPFWKAENYHQDYYKTHSLKYHYYRRACGRDRRVKKVWGSAEH